MNTCVLIKMGGSGTRFGSETPKQFCEVKDGKPLFSYVLNFYATCPYVNMVIVVTNKDWLDYTKLYAQNILGDKLVNVVVGGNTNAKSTLSGIKAARDVLTDDDIVLIHDATNPMTNSDTVLAVIEAAQQYNFASAYTEQVHATYEKDQEEFVSRVIDRSTVASGYSPEAYKFGIIYHCFETATEEDLETMNSSVAIAEKYGAKTKLVKSPVLNLKITYQKDLDVFRKLVD